MDGAVVGFVSTLPAARPAIRVRQLELGAGGHWPEVMPGLLAALAGRAAPRRSCSSWAPSTRRTSCTAGRSRRGAGRPRWAVRLPDPPAFLRRIAPALEVRLAHSPLAQHSGDLVLGNYRTGLRLHFEQGHLAQVDEVPVTTEHPGDVSLPGLLVTHLLLGHRTLGELEAVLPDVMVHRPGARPLVDALFPRRPSNPWALN